MIHIRYCGFSCVCVVGEYSHEIFPGKRWLLCCVVCVLCLFIWTPLPISSVAFHSDRIYNRNGSRWPIGVVPRLLRPLGGTVGGSIDVLRGVCMPDGVEVPLRLRLMMTKRFELDIAKRETKNDFHTRQYGKKNEMIESMIDETMEDFNVCELM